MAEDLIIQLEPTKWKTVEAGLDSVSAKLDKIGKQLLDLNGLNVRLNTGGGSGGSGGSKSASTPKVPALPAWARPSALQQSINKMQQAQQAGNSAAVASFNAKILKGLPVPALPKASAISAPPALPASLLQRLGGVAMSSRFGIGGGGGMQLMPLVGQAVKALAPEIGAALGPGALAAMQPLLGAAAIASVGLKLLFDAADNAAKVMASFAMAGAISGGSAGETGRLNAIGAAYGMSGEAIAGKSRGIAGQLAGGYGMVVGANAGVHNVMGGSPWAEHTDTAGDTLKLIEYIGNSKTSFHDATVAAQLFGLEFALMDRQLDDATKEQRKRQGDLTSVIGSPTNIRAAVAFKENLAQIGTSIGQISEVIGGQAMQALNPFVQAIAYGMDRVAQFTVFLGRLNDVLMGPIRGLLIVLSDIGSGAFDKAIEDLNKLRSGDWMKDPARDLRDAAGDLVKATRQGTFGGDDRSRSAMPAGLSGINFGMSWGVRDAANMGAFGGG